MRYNEPRGSIYTTIMELGPKRPSPLWFWGPNSILVVYMDPLGKLAIVCCSWRKHEIKKRGRKLGCGTVSACMKASSDYSYLFQFFASLGSELGVHVFSFLQHPLFAGRRERPHTRTQGRFFKSRFFKSRACYKGYLYPPQENLQQ